jgi:hypothetical protein
MNYYISQIKNLEDCNAAVPLSLLHEAIVDVVRDEWLDDVKLCKMFFLESFRLDLKETTKRFNDDLSEAGVVSFRVTEADVQTALGNWASLWVDVPDDEDNNGDAPKPQPLERNGSRFGILYPDTVNLIDRLLNTGAAFVIGWFYDEKDNVRMRFGRSESMKSHLQLEVEVSDGGFNTARKHSGIELANVEDFNTELQWAVSEAVDNAYSSLAAQ